MPVLSMLTPRYSCLAATKIHIAKPNERSAASSRLITFNVDVRCSSQVNLVIRMSYSQLGTSSSGSKCGRQHGQTVSGSINFILLSVGVAEGRFVFVFFHDLCLFVVCYLTIM